jgi:hypothetical protein
MARCHNCGELAAYTCADTGLNPVNYCANCLPVWLQERANAGSFPLVEQVATTVAPTTEAPEAEPVEKPTTFKKKAASEDANSN